MTNDLEIRYSQRFPKRVTNAASVECGHGQTNSKKENIMNTYTNAMHPKKKVHRTTRNNLFNNAAIIAVGLALVIVAAIAVNMANRPAVVAENNRALPYGNSLEMQYAQPWLNAQGKPVLAYGNALEAQYAQPWLQGTNLSILVTGSETSLDCHSSLETLYACKYGYGHP
jgi:hypothetical protein